MKVAVIAIAILLMGCSEGRQLKYIEQAEEKASQGRYAESSELLRKAIAINPDSKTAVKAIYKLGFTQETQLKDFEGALFNYQEFVRLTQDRVAAYEVQKRISSLLFEQSKELDKAIAAYKKLIAMNPESLEIDSFQFRIAQAFFRQNNFEQSRIEYQTLLEKFPKSQYAARVRFEIGNAYYMEGKYEISEEALKQVLRHHSQSEIAVEAQFLMAQCLEHQEKPDNALQIYENIRGRYPAPEVLELRIAELKKRKSKQLKISQ